MGVRDDKMIAEILQEYRNRNISIDDVVKYTVKKVSRRFYYITEIIETIKRLNLNVGDRKRYDMMESYLVEIEDSITIIRAMYYALFKYIDELSRRR